jgi:hypothetical protein
MTLFYCSNCNTVYAFNMYDIIKHDLEKPYDKQCSACKAVGTFYEIETNEKYNEKTHS